MDDIKRVQLSEIAELITKGTTPTTLGYEFRDSGVNFLKIECFDEHGMFIKNKVAHISEECHEKLKRSQLKDGDVLFSIAGAIGRVAIVTEEMLPANTNQALAIIRITNEEVYLPYIKLILTSPIVKEQFEKKKQGVAQLNLSLKDISEISIPLPNLEKQIKLAELFGKVENVIAKRSKEIYFLDELIKARFIELFIGKGYPVTSIKELLVQNSTVEKISNTKIEKFVTVGIKGKGAREREIKDGKWPVPFSGYRVNEGQFIYSRIDARNGAFAILPKEVDGAVVSKDFPVFEIKADKMLPNVLLFSVLQDDFVRQIQNSSFGATNRQRIQEEVFGEYRITLPPMEIQNQFTAFVEQTDKSKFILPNF